MRTVINLDDDAIREVMRIFDVTTKTDAVNMALREMIRIQRGREAFDRLMEIEPPNEPFDKLRREMWRLPEDTDTTGNAA
jgi:Arc/MetJ family transcription regulator